MKKTNRGFTLIELLVVIAIIGILSAIVLASLSTARGKANDAKVQGQLSSMRAAAEIYYSTNNSYGITATTCSTASSLFVDTASGMNGLVVATAAVPGTTVACQSTSAAWAVSSKLPSNASAYFCVDSTGKSASTSGAVTSAVCP